MARFPWFVRAVVLIAVLTSAVPIAAVPAAALEDAAIEAAVAATVQVGVLMDAPDGRRIWVGVGSGAVVTADGLVLTNRHVVDEETIRAELAPQEVAEYAIVPGAFAIATSDGRTPPELRFVATVAAEDAALDLAVLRIERDERDVPLDPAGLALPALPLGSVATLDLGDPLNLFGYPAIGGHTLTYTRGIVAGFTFEAGIDGPAWIKTDAVMSGGNSGGAVVDEAGRLVGIPTRGSQLDCRPGDSNRDGVEDATDAGCVPTGGSIGEIRPIDVALPLLRSVAPDLSAPDGATAQPQASGDPAQPTAVDPAAARATADACAARGDWRCAVRSYDAARAVAPDDPALAAAAYDALLGLGGLEEDAAQLGAARDAYSRAREIDPERPEAPVALDRLAPYAAIRSADGFAGQPGYAVADDPAADSSATYEDGRFRMTVRAPGVISTFPIPADDRPANWAVALDVAEAGGSGAVILSLAGPDGAWLVAADPEAGTWSVLGQEAGGGSFVERVAPTDYAGIAGQSLARLEVRAIGPTATVFVNGVDVSTPLGVALPATAADAPIGFGASMDPDGGEPFTAAFDRVSVYDLP